MKHLSTKEKAVKINIESNFFGTIAEIGGGQETARHLFQAGGASNTIAKSISAYDKRFSDHFYNEGKSSRYVAQDRLDQMLAEEYLQLTQVLTKERNRKFFVFGNTVETLNFHKNNQGHGWLGISVEGKDRKYPNTVVVHIKLLENDALLQQYTLGALGINLIYAGLFNADSPADIIGGLVDNLDLDRIEIDYINFEGPEFKNVDNRLMNVMLVKNSMTPAIMFDPEGKVHQPADMLYKKNVLAVRGFFRPINKLGMDIINDSLEVFKNDEEYESSNTISFCEITLNYLMQGEDLDEKDFLHRVDILNMMGQYVMVSNLSRFFQLGEYFTKFQIRKLRVVVGMPTFVKILDESYYKDLKGGLMEAMGQLFQRNTKLYVYPSVDDNSKEVITPVNAEFPGNSKLMLEYLFSNRRIVILKNVSQNHLYITTQEVSELIRKSDHAFCDMVPKKVSDYVIQHKIFGYQGPA